jgi:hypothetical protein
MTRCVDQDHLSHLHHVWPVGILSLESLINTQNLEEQTLNQRAMCKAELSEEFEDEMLVLEPEMKQIVIEFLILIIYLGDHTFNSFCKSYV